MLLLSYKNYKRRQLFKNRNYIKKLKHIIEWVEEITIKLRFNMITKEELESISSISYINKWEEYIDMRKFVEEILGGEGDNIDILEKIRLFRQ